MSLDELPPLVAHRRLTLQEVEDEERAARYEELRVRDLCESVEARESHWAGAFAAASRIPWRALPDQDMPGYERPLFDVDGDRETPEPVYLPEGIGT